jgi:streptogramin lyase
MAFRVTPLVCCCAALGLYCAAPARADFLVVSTFSDEVIQLSDNGGFRRTFVTAESGGLNAPRAATWGPDGNLYVADFPGKILAYDGTTGAFLRSVFDLPGAGWHGLHFAPNGDLLATSLSADVIYRLNVDPARASSVVGTIGAGVLSDPIKMIPAPDGTLLVANAGHDDRSIYRVDLNTNQVLGKFTTDALLHGAAGLDYGPDGNLYTCLLYGDYSVYRIDRHSGALLGRFDSGASLFADGDLLFTPNGALWVAGINGNTLWRLDAVTGEYQSEVSVGGGLLDLLYVPEPTAVPALGVAGLLARRRRHRPANND